ncbi:MAG: hypothetical protein AAFU61_08145 [Pseudomonadota bacterium]
MTAHPSAAVGAMAALQDDIRARLAEQGLAPGPSAADFADRLADAEDRLRLARNLAIGNSPASPDGREAARAAHDVLADCPLLAAEVRALAARVAGLQCLAETLVHRPEETT